MSVPISGLNFNNENHEQITPEHTHKEELEPEKRYLCDCGHKYQRHLFALGCLSNFCKCEAYSQIHRIKNLNFKESPEWDL